MDLTDYDLTTLFRHLEKLQIETLAEPELIRLQGQLSQCRGLVDTLLGEVLWSRAERWWNKIPPEEIRLIRLLIKGSELTPEKLQQFPELSHLLLLTNLEDPDVVRLWASMTPDIRSKHIEELQRAASLMDNQRTSNSWQDAKEAASLAYEVLGLTSTASWEEVRKAYRELVNQYHPDKGGDPLQFKALQKAFKLLQARHNK